MTNKQKICYNLVQEVTTYIPQRVKDSEANQNHLEL